jgi:hypothetical protein
MLSGKQKAVPGSKTPKSRNKDPSFILINNSGTSALLVKLLTEAT